MSGNRAMEIGVGLPDGEEVATSAHMLEEVGIDYVFSGEHFFFHVPVGNAFITLAAAAGATERIKLLSAITLLPLYPAAMAAKMASALDVVSGGRFQFGVGAGGEYPPEFEALGVAVKDRGSRMDESLRVIHALFSGERTSFDGKFTKLSEVALQPPPAQPGGPPIWIAGRSEAAQRRAGHHADVWMPYMYTPEQLEKSMVTVSEVAAEAGRETDAVDGSLFVWVCVDEDGDDAREEITEAVSRTYNQDFSELGRFLVAGTPEEVVGRLCEYGEAGARSAQLMLGCRQESRQRVLDLLVAEVLPRLQG